MCACINQYMQQLAAFQLSFVIYFTLVPAILKLHCNLALSDILKKADLGTSMVRLDLFLLVGITHTRRVG